MLGDYAEGNIVLLNENGVPVEFYVAKHDYESGLNGAGRTLLVRKNLYDKSTAWNSSGVNAYAASTINNWCNGTYKALHDADVQAAMGLTNFYCTRGNGNNTVETLSRAVFILSLRELGRTSNNAKQEGTALPVASILRTVYFNGSTSTQWTRTAEAHVSSATYNAFYLYAAGTAGKNNVGSAYGTRPCFTLPANARFDPESNAFISA
jgi:hypothetical protein